MDHCKYPFFFRNQHQQECQEDVLFHCWCFFWGAEKNGAFLKKPLFITIGNSEAFFDSSNINPVAGSVTPKLGCSNRMGFSPSGKNRFNRGKKGRRWLRSLKSHRVCGVCSGESMKDPTRILPPIPLPFHHGWK